MLPIFGIFKTLSLGKKLLAIGIPILVVAGLIFSIYMIGYTKGKAISKVAIAEYESKLATLQAKLNNKQVETNTEVVTVYKDRMKVVEQVVYRNKEVVKLVPSVGNLTEGWIHTYNQSVEGEEADPEKAASATDSGISDVRALGTIVENNGVCKAKEVQLDSWKSWYDKTKANYEKVNQ